MTTYPAGEIRVKVFPSRTTTDELERLVHEWLEKNSRLEVVDIKFGNSWGGGGNRSWYGAMVVYRQAAG